MDPSSPDAPRALAAAALIFMYATAASGQLEPIEDTGAQLPYASDALVIGYLDEGFLADLIVPGTADGTIHYGVPGGFETRPRMIEGLYGSRAFHRDRYAKLLGF